MAGIARFGFLSGLTVAFVALVAEVGIAASLFFPLVRAK
jgi:hypothetical protein